jgi:DNA invertase Pin-like site-specific DNA recombinase
MPKRFVSWAAVSSLPQAKKISVDDQLATNREHIEKWGGTLVRELPIRGKSRSISSFEKACDSIKEYADLREMIERRAFDVLIYLDRSRLGRKSRLIDAIVDECHDAGILTYSTESPPASLDVDRDNFASKVVGAIESIMAQEEVKTMMRRHAMGMAARVRDGDFPGRIPYGWKVRYELVDDKPVRTVEVDEDAKEVLHQIFALFLEQGLSGVDIAEHLQNKGVPSPSGKPWLAWMVHAIVNLAPRYAGTLQLNRKSKKRAYVESKNKWPAIIGNELASRIMAEKKRRGCAKRAVHVVHRFSQIVWCEKCQRKMHGRWNWRTSRRDPNVRTRFEDYCCALMQKAGHAQWHIVGAYVVDAVRHAIEYVKDEANRQKILDQYVDKTPAINTKIKKAQARLSKHEEAEERLDHAYIIVGKMTPERYEAQVKTLENLRRAIEAEIEQLQAELHAEQFDQQRPERLREFASEGLAMLDCPDIQAANAWFRRHIKVWLLCNDPDGEKLAVEYL